MAAESQSRSSGSYERSADRGVRRRANVRLALFLGLLALSFYAVMFLLFAGV